MQLALHEQAIKDALRSTTDEALALGVFGVPTLTVGGELFWGDDRLADAAGASAQHA
jgi:2-hydroxychromene-2-carboxylate isomerase